MQTSSPVPECLNCQRSEAEAMLLSIRFRGAAAWICSRCFPTLIHNPAKLAGRLDGAETLTPGEHDDN
jgi:hypothetical protein